MSKPKPKKPRGQKVPEDGMRTYFDPIDREHIEQEARRHGSTQKYIKSLVTKDRVLKELNKKR